MYVLITANRNYSSWSLRPWVLMRALGIAFEDQIEPFTNPINYDAFRSFSPTGQVPALLDEGRTVYDSLGITLYLADRHEGVWPTDPDARAWAQCATAEMHSGFSALRGDCTMNVGVRVTPKAPSGALRLDVARIRELFADGLSRFGGPFLALYRGRCLLCPGRFPYPHLWPRRRRRTGVGRPYACAARYGRMGTPSARRKLARRGPRGGIVGGRRDYGRLPDGFIASKTPFALSLSKGRPFL